MVNKRNFVLINVQNAKKNDILAKQAFEFRIRQYNIVNLLDQSDKITKQIFNLTFALKLNNIGNYFYIIIKAPESHYLNDKSGYALNDVINSEGFVYTLQNNLIDIAAKSVFDKIIISEIDCGVYITLGQPIDPLIIVELAEAFFQHIKLPKHTENNIVIIADIKRGKEFLDCVIILIGEIDYDGRFLKAKFSKKKNGKKAEFCHTFALPRKMLLSIWDCGHTIAQ